MYITRIQYLILLCLVGVIDCFIGLIPAALYAKTLEQTTPTTATTVGASEIISWNPPGTLSFDVTTDPFYGQGKWHQSTLKDGAIILSNAAHLVEEYPATGSASVRVDTENLYFIMTAQSKLVDEELVALAVKKFFGDADSFKLDEPDHRAVYRGGGVVTGISATISGKSAINVLDSNGVDQQYFTVSAHGMRLQDGRLGIVVGINPNSQSERLVLTLSSSDSPLVTDDKVIDLMKSLSSTVVQSSTLLSENDEPVNLTNTFETDAIATINYQFAYPQNWVVVQNNEKYKDRAFIGSSYEAILAIQQNLSLPKGEFAGIINVYLNALQQSDGATLPLDTFLKFHLKIYEALQQSEPSDVIYIDDYHQQAIAFASIQRQHNQGTIVGFNNATSQVVLELYAADSTSNWEELPLAAEIAQSIQPLTRSYRDKVKLTQLGTVRDSFVGGFQEFVFYYPGNGSAQDTMIGMGTFVELPIKNPKQRGDVATIVIQGVPLFSPEQFFSLFDMFGLGIQSFDPPEGFLLGNKWAMAAKGKNNFTGSHSLLIVVKIGTTADGRAEYASINGSVPDGVSLEDYETTIYAIAESIRKAIEPESPSSAVTDDLQTAEGKTENVAVADTLQVKGKLYVDSLCVQPGDTVRVNASGSIQVGAFAGSVDANGTEGMLLGDSYDLVRPYPHGALLCRIAGENDWQLCGSFLEFTASSAGCLEFEVNDNDQSNNIGYFTVDASILSVEPMANETAPASAATTPLTSTVKTRPSGTIPTTLEEILPQADAYYWDGYYDEAFALYEKALEIKPDSVEALTGQGNIYRIREEFQLGKDALERAVELDPTYAPAYRGLGRYYYLVGDKTRSFQFLNKALELDPAYARGYETRADIYTSEGEYDLAMADFDKAIAIDPSIPDLYASRGDLHYYMGNYDLSLKDNSTAIQLDPTYVLGYANRGDAYYAKENYPASLEEYNRALALDPTHAYSYFGLGRTYEAMESWTNAEANYTKAVVNGSSFGELYSRRGYINSKLGRTAQGLADYNKALELDPNDALAYYNRGMTYDEMGEDKKAFDDFFSYLELDETNSELAEYACYRVDDLNATIIGWFSAPPCTRFINSYNEPICYQNTSYLDYYGDPVTEFSCYHPEGGWIFDKVCTGSGWSASCTCPYEWEELGVCR